MPPTAEATQVDQQHRPPHFAVLDGLRGAISPKNTSSPNGGLGPAVALGTVTMVAFACLVMNFYDKPVRAWLRTKAARPTG